MDLDLDMDTGKINVLLTIIGICILFGLARIIGGSLGLALLVNINLFWFIMTLTYMKDDYNFRLAGIYTNAKTVTGSFVVLTNIYFVYALVKFFSE